jgi:hypothetical protein
MKLRLKEKKEKVYNKSAGKWEVWGYNDAIIKLRWIERLSRWNRIGLGTLLLFGWAKNIFSEIANRWFPFKKGTNLSSCRLYGQVGFAHMNRVFQFTKIHTSSICSYAVIFSKTLSLIPWFMFFQKHPDFHKTVVTWKHVSFSRNWPPTVKTEYVWDLVERFQRKNSLELGNHDHFAPVANPYSVKASNYD